MLWAISAALLVALVGNIALVIHFIDVLTSERAAHRDEVRALLARAGAPISVTAVTAAEPRESINESKYVFDPTGLEAPLPRDQMQE